MSTGLYAEVDGLMRPLTRCDWVRWDECGCPTGVMVASYAPTEEDVWKEFYDLKRDRDRAQKRGVRMELMSHERYSAEVCPLMLDRSLHDRHGQQELPLTAGPETVRVTGGRL